MTGPTLHVVGDVITDEYILVEPVGMGDEGVSVRYRFIEKILHQGGASFVHTGILDQIFEGKLVASDDKPVIDQLYYASDYHITRYMTRENDPTSILLTYEDELCRFSETETSFKHWEESDFVVLWDADRGYRETNTLNAAYEYAKEIGATIIVDCSSPEVFERYPEADIYKINGSEWMSAKARYDPGTGEYIGDYFNQTKSLLIVTGPMVNTVQGTYRGCFYEQNIRTSCADTIITDTIGAGDVFLARLTYLLAKGKEVDYAVREAGNLATESTKHFGCYFPTEYLKGTR
tara:strand:+ start:3851 stop:4723 length:873 start_codon:yes stop_codon:yes gene_type:complete